MKLIGALTSKPYAFKARPWELENINSIDYHDANGTNIKVSLRGSEILRILPKINNNINEEWISDKIRFSYDGLNKQRLFSPLLKLNGKFKKISWQEAFNLINTKFKEKYFFEGICGNLIESESMFLFKELLTKIGNSSIESRNSFLNIDNDLRENYLMNTTFDNINKADVCLLVGTNLRIESPILNLKIRKNKIKNNLHIYILGYNPNLNYETITIGNNTKHLLNLIEGKNYFCKNLINSNFPLTYIGTSLLQQSELSNILNKFKSLFIKNNWNGFNILHQNSSIITGLELNCINNKKTLDYNYQKKVIYIYNSDEIIVNTNNKNFIIYQGHTGDITAKEADLILPGSTLLEKNGTLINNEGRVQDLGFCLKPPADARNDWKIFEALGNFLGLSINYTKIENIQKNIKEISPQKNLDNIGTTNIEIKNKLTYISNSYILSYINNFYMTDIISKNSNVMALATNRFLKSKNNFIDRI